MKQRCEYTPGLTKLTQRWGVLDLDVDADRLSFTLENGKAVVSGPLSSFHSPRNWLGSGVTVYQGARRYRFDFENADELEAVASMEAFDQPLYLASDARREANRVRRAAADAAAWTRALTAVLPATPPAGVRIRHTMGPDERMKALGAALAVGIVVALLFMGAIVLAALRFG